MSSSLESQPIYRPQLAPVTLWRGMIVFCALHGLYNVIGMLGSDSLLALNWEGLYELSQLASLIVAVCYLALLCFPLFTRGRRHEPRSSWLRGALAVMMLLVSLTSILILDGGKLGTEGFFFEHLVTPVLVVADFLFVGRGQYRTKWWHPITWLLLPLAYFGSLLSIHKLPYPGLFDTTRPAMLAISAGCFTVALLLLGYALWALTKLFGLAVKPIDSTTVDATGEAAQQAAVEGDVEAPQQGVSPYFVRQR